MARRSPVRCRNLLGPLIPCSPNCGKAVQFTRHTILNVLLCFERFFGYYQHAIVERFGLEIICDLLGLIYIPIFEVYHQQSLPAQEAKVLEKLWDR